MKRSAILHYKIEWATACVCKGVPIVRLWRTSSEGTSTDLHGRFDALPLVVLYELLSLALYSRYGITLWGAVLTLD